MSSATLLTELIMAASLIIEEVTDPTAIEAARGRARQASSNAGWLEEHWPDLLPRARGKFIALAGGQGFVAETVQDAWAWIDENHPGDGGAFVQYVPSVPGPRIYANRRHLAQVR
jgi:hypothetical protein